MHIAMQLKAAQANAERQIRALDRVAEGLRPTQVLRWVERVLDDRSEHLDRIGDQFHRRTHGTLRLKLATSPQRVKELTAKFAQALTGGEDASEVRSALLSSFRFSDEAGRILYDSTVPLPSADPAHKLAKIRCEMAECRSSFRNRRPSARLLGERCRLLQKKGEALLASLEDDEGFREELASFERFSALVRRVPAA